MKVSFDSKAVATHKLRTISIVPFLLRCHFSCLFLLLVSFLLNQGPQGLPLQGLSSCLQMLGFDPMPPYMEGGGQFLGNSHQADLIFSRLSVQLLCDQHIGNSHVCCWLHQRSCRIDGFLREELSLKKSLVYSVSDFIFHQSCDALGTSPSLPPLRGLASNFPLQETSAGEARLGLGLLQDIGQAHHPDPVT